MAKCCSASVVTAVLLGCLLGIQIEAQHVQVVVDQGLVQPSKPRQQLHQIVVGDPLGRKLPQVHQSHSIQKPAWSQNQHQNQHHSLNKCDLTDNVKVICGHQRITAQECDALNCCFDGRQCYYGRAVTLQCTKTGEFIVVVAKDITVPDLDLETISLLAQGHGCTHIDSSSAFAIYQFPVSSCGTIVMEDSNTIIYENRMVSSYEVGIGRLGAITRDSQFELIVQCRYLGGIAVKALIFDDIQESIHWQVNGTGLVHVELLVANGVCTTKGCNEYEAAYTSFYTEYPVTKALREPVFVAVRLTGLPSSVHLTLGRCWATYGPSPHSMPQWDILINGCPYEDDKYLSKVIRVGAMSGVPYPNQQKRFMFQMFTFVNDQTLAYMSEQLYLHCSTYLCIPTHSHTCQPSCLAHSYRNKRDVDTGTQENTISRVTSVGPLIFRSDEE